MQSFEDDGGVNIQYDRTAQPYTFHPKAVSKVGEDCQKLLIYSEIANVQTIVVCDY